jgi:hypothetical protein
MHAGQRHVLTPALQKLYDRERQFRLTRFALLIQGTMIAVAKRHSRAITAHQAMVLDRPPRT